MSITGKVYKIVNITDPSIVYIGSTQQKLLSMRMKGHRNDSKRIPNHWINHYGNGLKDWYIELLEIIEFWDKDQLRKAESYHFIKYKKDENLTVLNKLEPFHSDSYAKRYTTREKDLARNKQWHLDNKDRLKCENPKCNFKCVKKYHLDRHYRSKKHKNNLIKTKIVKKSHPYNDKNIAKSINKTIPFCL